MYNVYHGSGGAPKRVAESTPHVSRRSPLSALLSVRGTDSAPAGDPIRQGVESLVARITGELETEDLILLLILYLMYRESGDTELLLIMGAMYLL